VPLVYKPNGAFPEEEPPNPADGLVPVAYFDNGQYRLSIVASSRIIPFVHSMCGMTLGRMCLCVYRGMRDRVAQAPTCNRQANSQTDSCAVIRYPEEAPPNPAAGLVPVQYDSFNGMYPEPVKNPAAGLSPVKYDSFNGMYPEPVKNPAASLSPVKYNAFNGMYPEPVFNPAAGLSPVKYNAFNGMYPEPVFNPAAGLVPVRYNQENGQVPESAGQNGRLKVGPAGVDSGRSGQHHPTSYMPPPLNMAAVRKGVGSTAADRKLARQQAQARAARRKRV